MPATPRTTRRTFSSLLLASPVFGYQPARQRLRRAESFFGLHFDLHPNDRDRALGRDVTEPMIEDLLRTARPDYVQYDAKGHAGWLGWPSDVGPSSPGIVADSLAVWRKVTARNGVALYIHFSGVWDAQAITRHPEWARLDAKGKPDGRNTSTFSPYADRLMIPQLREAATRYELDGAWVDGECWSTYPDYSPTALGAWRKATGRAEAPRSAKDPHWLEFLEFNREQFRRYVRHYVDELHRSHPKFQVASNWLYSTMVPEEPVLPVDFLSGDYLGNASITGARIEARYLAQTGKPWDLMAWGFQQANSNAIGHVHKPAVQLQQEASVVLAQGGGFQIYYQPSRAGHFEKSHVEVMGKVAAFCRARQQASHQSETVPQIGVLFSKHALYASGDRLFGGWGKLLMPVRGTVDALLACGYSVDLLPDWKLERTGASYPLIVVPDWTDPGTESWKFLAGYARKGGRLVVFGAQNARRWAREAGLNPIGEPSETPAYLSGGEVLGNARGLWLELSPDAGKVIETRVPALDSRLDKKPAALAAGLGQGEVVFAPGPIGYVYAATHAPAIRDFVRRLVGPRFRPLVAVEGPPTLEVVLRRKSGRLHVHLLNATAMQVAGDFAAMDYVPPVGPVRVSWPDRPPARVRLLPEGVTLSAKQGAFTVSQVALHSILTPES